MQKFRDLWKTVIYFMIKILGVLRCALLHIRDTRSAVIILVLGSF